MFFTLKNKNVNELLFTEKPIISFSSRIQSSSQKSQISTSRKARPWFPTQAGDAGCKVNAYEALSFTVLPHMAGFYYIMPYEVEGRVLPTLEALIVDIKFRKACRDAANMAACCRVGENRIQLKNTVFKYVLQGIKQRFIKRRFCPPRRAV